MNLRVKSLIAGVVVAIAGFTIYIPKAEANGSHYEGGSYSHKSYESHKSKYREKEHQEPEPSYSCDDLSVSEVSRDTYRFTAAATAENGADITGWEYDFGDGTKVHGDAAKTTVKHTYAQPGTYTVTAMVEVGVDGTFYGERSDACKVTVTVEDEPCPISGKEDVSKDSADCKEDLVVNKVKVRDMYTKKIVKIDENRVDQARYVSDRDHCRHQPVVRTTSVRSEPAPPAVNTPTKLPETGLVDVALSSLGIGSLVGAGYYYIGSRRMVAKLEK